MKRKFEEDPPSVVPLRCRTGNGECLQEPVGSANKKIAGDDNDKEHSGWDEASQSSAEGGVCRRQKRQHTIRSSYLHMYVDEVDDEDSEKVAEPLSANAGSKLEIEEIVFNEYEPIVEEELQDEELNLPEADRSSRTVEIVELDDEGNEVLQVDDDEDDAGSTTDFEEMDSDTEENNNNYVSIGPGSIKNFLVDGKPNQQKPIFSVRASCSKKSSTITFMPDFESKADSDIDNAVTPAAERRRDPLRRYKKSPIVDCNQTDPLEHADAKTRELVESIYGNWNKVSSTNKSCGGQVLKDAEANRLPKPVVDMTGENQTKISPAASAVGEIKMERNEASPSSANPASILPPSGQDDDSSTDYTTEEEDNDDLLSIHSDEDEPNKENVSPKRPSLGNVNVKSEPDTGSNEDASFCKPLTKNIAAAKLIKQSICSTPKIPSDNFIDLVDDDEDEGSDSSMTTVRMAGDQSLLEPDMMEDSDCDSDAMSTSSLEENSAFSVEDYYGSFMGRKQSNVHDYRRTPSRGRGRRARGGRWSAHRSNISFSSGHGGEEELLSALEEELRASNEPMIIGGKSVYYDDVRRFIKRLVESNKSKPVEEENYDEAELPPMKVKLYHHQAYGLKWLLWREAEFPRGGILADEMGLGKTIMMLALIKKTKLEYEKPTVGETKGCISSVSTLVVAPLSCLYQWRDEIRTKAGNLSVCIYHGTDRFAVGAQSLSKYDMVLTTFDVIAHEIPSGDKVKSMVRVSPLKQVYWLRIVLDEGHVIRNPKTKRALAACQLEARHRWVVTGTPIHNSTSDFFSLIKFLRMEPFDDIKVWNNWIRTKLENRSEGDQRRLHILGQTLILRRTKLEVQALKKDSDCSGIPPKSVEIVAVELDDNERAIYDQLMTFSQSIFKEFLEERERRRIERAMGNAGITMIHDPVSKSQDLRDAKAEWNELNQPIQFLHLFALIVRLRQCAVLPFLIRGILEDTEGVNEEPGAIREGLEKLIRIDNPLFSDKYQSSKIKKILEDLEELRKTTTDSEGRMNKVVIVSSWVKLLNALYVHLKAKGFTAVFLTGQDNVEDRMYSMNQFNGKGKTPEILLLSLHAGAVGINLTGGNHVFFVEPHWNPQIERQAQDRVHRFGQKRDVTIRRYITGGTIEDRIMDLQEKKIELADGMLANTKAAAGGLNLQQMHHLFEC